MTIACVWAGASHCFSLCESGGAAKPSFWCFRMQSTEHYGINEQVCLLQLVGFWSKQGQRKNKKEWLSRRRTCWLGWQLATNEHVWRRQIHWQHDRNNVLWALPTLSMSGYHRGDVALRMLHFVPLALKHVGTKSPFRLPKSSNERHDLFPPIVMIVLMPRPVIPQQ